MSRIADYTIITAGAFAFGEPLVTHSFPFNLPDGFQAGSRCILSFNLGGIRGDDDALRLRVSINGHPIYSYDSTADFFGFWTVQQVVAAGVLVVGGPNEITFRRESGFGHAQLSDVVLLCQVDTSLMRSVQIDDHGNIFAGGGTVDGDLVLRSNNGSDRVRLDATEASAWIGGNLVDGHLRLFRSDGDNKSKPQATIHLDGGSGDVRLGSNGSNGDVMLFPSQVASNNASGSDASVRLDGFNAKVTVGGGGEGEIAASRDGEIVDRKSVV